MNILKIALLQISPTGNIDKNLNKGIAYCKKAKDLNADIVLFPEMFSNGYNIYDRPYEEWKNDAIGINHNFVKSFGEFSKENNIATGITFLQKTNNDFQNSFVLFDRFGNAKLNYSKVHTCDFSTERYLTPGDEFNVCDLDTLNGTVKIGAMICYDREFPESARILMLKGAEIILVPNACPMEINRISQLRGRAYENMVGIATCNYPDTVPDCNGHSNAFDGMAYLPDISGSRDTCILEAGGDEGIYIAEFDLDLLRQYRKKEVHGNTYRKPYMYDILSKNIKSEPFIRKDYRP